MAISRIQGVSATTTNVAISTPTAGDVILVFAYRSASTTIPTLATGYTKIHSGSGNTNAAILAYKYSNGTETTSGTWTNADNVVCFVYRGCDPHYPIGGWSVHGASSATISYDTFTVWQATSTSWIASFAGNKTSLVNTAPTGMTSVTNQTKVIGSDTNAVANSWSTQTVAGNSNTGYLSYVVELRTKPASVSNPSPDYLVQHVCGSNMGGGQSPTTVKATLPNASLSGNCIVVSVACFNGDTVSVADDKSNTYTLRATGNDATNGYWCKMFVAPNTTAGVREITVTVNDGGNGAVAIQVAEFYNIDTGANPVDVNNGTGSITLPSAIQPGSITTTQANDLIYHVAFSTSQFSAGGNQPLYKRITGDSNLTLCATDLLDGVMAQYGIKTAAGAINPMFNTSPTGTATSDLLVTAVIALKTATAGTAPSGKRIVRVQACNYMRSSGPAINLQFPCTGNLVVATWLGFDHTAATGRALSGVADTYSNTWTESGTSVTNDGGTAQLFYSLAPTIQPNYCGPTLTVTGGNVQEQSNGLLYDIQYEGKTWAHDVAAATTGTQSVDTDLTSVSITPTNSDGIIISNGGIDLNTISGIVGAGFVFDAMVYPEADGSKNFYEDNPAGHFMNSDTTARTFVWTQQGVSAGVDGWAIRAASFQASGGASLTADKWLTMMDKPQIIQKIFICY